MSWTTTSFLMLDGFHLKKRFILWITRLLTPNNKRGGGGGQKCLQCNFYFSFSQKCSFFCCAQHWIFIYHSFLDVLSSSALKSSKCGIFGIAFSSVGIHHTNRFIFAVMILSFTTLKDNWYVTKVCFTLKRKRNDLMLFLTEINYYVPTLCLCMDDYNTSWLMHVVQRSLHKWMLVLTKAINYVIINCTDNKSHC